MPRADFLTGLVLIGIAVALVGEGLRLPGAVGMIEQGGEPGRVPIFLGLVIGALAAILIVRAIAQNGHRLSVGKALDADRKSAIMRALATAVGCTLYVGLLGRTVFGIEFDYTWLTFGFVFAFIVISEWKLAPEIAGRRWQALNGRAPGAAARVAQSFTFLSADRAPYVWLVLTAAIQAALVALVVAYVFESQFFVKLP